MVVGTLGDAVPLEILVAAGADVVPVVGAAAARTEMAVVLEELLERTTHIAVDGSIEMVPWPLYGPARLPVSVIR